jgi:phosphoenolpyruvate carboxylase
VRLEQLLYMFPTLVVPLELRESSDVLLAAARGAPTAIERMIRTLARISRGASPKLYARGLIISMASTIEHVRAATRLLNRNLGGLKIPVIPLFEQGAALQSATKIADAMLRERAIRAAVDRYWNGFFEIMLGYSDSAKEMGALASRLAISDAVRHLDRTCRRHGVTPLYFHGSGGSVDRGGGSIEEQTAWWPRSALSFYKATLQGEMVERSFASPEIILSQIEKIAGRGQEPMHRSRAVEDFADKARLHYQAKLGEAGFLDVIQRATMFRYLDVLRIGSRPSKRGKLRSVLSLRAIPWVLFWTQARVLFPTWWGVGAAWRECDRAERAALKRELARDPLFRSFVKLLGFTLAKVELPVWKIYLEEKGFEESVFEGFASEYAAAVAFVRAMSGEKNLLWFRPWLGTSITLRSPMIHPLNLLQILAIRAHDGLLLRETVAGISSGMMTTG